MDEKLKIKISIADRIYPLTVEFSQEEGLRSASKKIDGMITFIKELQEEQQMTTQNAFRPGA